MEPTTQHNTLRSVLIFIVIGAVLLAAVIFGVRWARGRSDQLANNNNQTQQEQPAATNGQQEEKPAQEQTAQTDQSEQDGQVAANPTPTTNENTATEQPATSQPVPAQVPSTGLENALLPILALGGMTYATTKYLQSRRRLALAK